MTTGRSRAIQAHDIAAANGRNPKAVHLEITAPNPYAVKLNPLRFLSPSMTVDRAGRITASEVNRPFFNAAMVDCVHGLLCS